MKDVPQVGNLLSNIPVLVSILRSFVAGEYTLIPTGSIVAILAALLYWVAPIDIIPDVIPGIGYIDDAIMVGICLKLTESDVETYREWREARKGCLPVQ